MFSSKTVLFHTCISPCSYFIMNDVIRHQEGVISYNVFNKKISEYMTRKFHNLTLQTNPWHLEEEPRNTNSHKTSGRHLKQPAGLYCKTIKYIKYCIVKQGLKTERPQKMGATINNEIQQQQKRRLTDSSQSNAFHWCQIFALENVVIKTHTQFFSSHGGPQLMHA